MTRGAKDGGDNEGEHGTGCQAPGHPAGAGRGAWGLASQGGRRLGDEGAPCTRRPDRTGDLTVLGARAKIRDAGHLATDHPPPHHHPLRVQTTDGHAPNGCSQYVHSSCIIIARAGCGTTPQSLAAAGFAWMLATTVAFPTLLPPAAGSILRARARAVS